MGRFPCTSCSKTYKFKTGLARHIQAKHTSHTSITVEEIAELLKAASENFDNDSRYPPDTRLITIDDVDLVKLHQDVSVPFEKLQETSDSDEFIAAFFGKIVRNSSLYAEDFDSPSARFVLKKLGDKILHFYRTSCANQDVIEPPKPVTPDDMDGIQHLAGYVVRKFLKKSSNNSPISKVLIEMKTTDYSDQKLIALQSRGGLTALTSEAQKIFVKAEERFRSDTNLREIFKIDTKEMVFRLMKDTDVISVYNRIIQDIEIDDDTRYGILMKMLGLYLRVRAFSLAKKLTTKHRLEKKKGKGKALRKELKEKSANYEQ